MHNITFPDGYQRSCK